MRAADKKNFDKYAIDPFEEEFMFDSFVEGWVSDIADGAPESDEIYVDDWDELV